MRSSRRSRFAGPRLNAGVRQHSRLDALSRMAPLTLNQIRLLAGSYLLVLLLSVGNHYFGWGLVGAADRKLLAAVALVGAVLAGRYGMRLQKRLEDHQTALRQADAAADAVRDKSNDTVEAERLGRAIGMPPNKSLERSRDR